MKKIEKLRLCNRSLIPVAIFMLASAIGLEVSWADGPLWVIFHIIIGVAIAVLVGWHLQLNRAASLSALLSGRGPAIRWLGLVFLLMAITGVASTIHWAVEQHHTSLGGVHGKIGFLFLLLAALHTIRHRRFYIRKK